MKSFVFKQKVLFRVYFLSVTELYGSMPQGGARGKNLGHLRFISFYFLLYRIIQFEQQVLLGVFLSVTSDCRFQCSRVGLEVKINDTPAGGIRASQGTFSSCCHEQQHVKESE